MLMRQRAFPGHRHEVEGKYLRAAHWLRASIYGDRVSRDWCDQQGVGVRKAAGEGIGSAGAFLIPPELMTAVVDLRDTYGAFRRTARIVPMKHDSIDIGRHIPTGTPTATFIAENSAASATTATLDNVSLSPKKLGVLIQVSTELEDDSIVDAIDFFANELAWAFATKEDDCAFNGDGTSGFGGMFGITNIVLDGNHSNAKVTAASGHNTFLNIDTGDLGSLMAGVQASAIPNAAWFCSQTCFAQTFCRLAGSGGGGYLEVRSISGIMTPFYLGFPVILSQKLPLISTTLTTKVMLAFGDMYGGAALGDRHGIVVARSPHRYLEFDQIGIFATERFDAVVHGMGDNTNRGRLAALVGN